MLKSIERKISFENEGFSDERLESGTGKLYQSLSDIGEAKKVSVSVKKDSIGTLHPQFMFGDKNIDLYIQSTGAAVGDIEGREMKYQVTLENVLLVPEYKQALEKSGIDYYIAGGINLQSFLARYSEGVELEHLDINTIKKELDIVGVESESLAFRSFLDKYCDIVNKFSSNGVEFSRVYKGGSFQIEASIIGKANFDKIMKNPDVLENIVKNILLHKNDVVENLRGIIDSYKFEKKNKEIEKKKKINEKINEL